jgi:cytochrome d ubiquinol oxidase subunit I
VDGLDKFKPEDRPPVVLTFHAYHIMIALGMFFIGITLFASFLLWRGVLFDQRWLLKIFVVSIVLPYAANQFGWMAAEVGRQPWVVYGLLRTSDAISKSVKASEVALSIAMFGVIYALLLLLYLYIMTKKIQHGPDEPADVATALGSQPSVEVYSNATMKEA